MKHILAMKSGWLIPVVPSAKTNTWDSTREKKSFYVPPSKAKTMRVFSGDDCTDKAIEWIEGGESVEKIKAERDALAAQVELLREAAQFAWHNWRESKDVHGAMVELLRAVESIGIPKRSDDVSGWREYKWPDKVPLDCYEFYQTDAGCLMFDGG